MKKKQKLWNRNFLLLWQGQTVSVLGDAFYDIAISFFVLELTGSTVVMGTVMALVTIPRILLGPAALIFGACASVFNPAVESVLPDLVSSENLIRGNLIFENPIVL